MRDKRAEKGGINGINEKERVELGLQEHFQESITTWKKIKLCESILKIGEIRHKTLRRPDEWNKANMILSDQISYIIQKGNILDIVPEFHD